MAQIEQLNFKEKEELLHLLQKTSLPKKPEFHPSHKISLNPNYTFENFIIGDENRFALVAAQSVAQTIGQSYNPLFIYGETGTGKTHLLHAIGNYVLGHNQEAKVIYVTTEQFSNEFIYSVDKNNVQNFREKFRGADVLLFDDFEFLAGKKQIQEEFFHILNALYEKSKQIVITANRPPEEIPAINELLRPRLKWGLIINISN